MKLHPKDIAFWISIISVVLVIMFLLYTPFCHFVPFGLILPTIIVLFIIAIITIAVKKSIAVGIISIFIIILVVFGPIFVFEAFIHNQGQSNIEYTVSITGLEGKKGNYVSDVIVPLPMQNGESLIPIDEIDGQIFGEWRAVLIGFTDRDGKMLAFQHGGTNLTDINAEFYHNLPNGLIVDDENKVYLSPALDGLGPLKMAGRFAWSSETSLDPFDYNYRSMVSLPDNLENKSESDEINFNILLRISTGKTGFLTVPADYRFTIHEVLNLDNSGFIPVNVNVHIS